ncbi:hypothetical protein SRHO_G00315060 [Serrasalmus rhombeus]
MAPSLLLASSCLLLASVATAKVCNDYTGHGVDAAWSAKDVPIMVLMPMNESALMSSISQGIEPAVQLAIRHIRESGNYSFSLITKIYDTERSTRTAEPIRSAGPGRYRTKPIHRATPSTATGEIQCDMQEKTGGTTKLLPRLRGMYFVVKSTVP